MDEDRVIRIEDTNDERCAVYTAYNEPQLLHYNEPAPGIFIAETPMVIGRALDFGARPLSFFIAENELENDAVKALIKRADRDTKLYAAPLSVIGKITGFQLTRGMLAAFERPQMLPAKTLLSKAKCVAVLEQINNPTNLGAIFRSAAALGVDGILLTRGCTDPFYRRAARVSMGTVFQVPWTYFAKGEDPADVLHGEGFSILSMALKKEALLITDPVLHQAEKKAIVFGTEGTGIKEETLEKSDHLVIIPMHNGVDSLNVAASSAVAFWELCGKRQ